MNDTKSPLRIDIVSDVMCPWCIIGYHQLVTALEASDVDHEIHWHPFELNPNMPPEGQDIGEHLAEKYGTTPEQSAANRSMMTARGKELGFEIVGEIGLDRVEAQAVLDDQRFANAVRQEQQFWTKQGITGVPAVVFDRQHLVTGAQGVDNFKSILEQLTT